MVNEKRQLTNGVRQANSLLHEAVAWSRVHEVACTCSLGHYGLIRRALSVSEFVVGWRTEVHFQTSFRSLAAQFALKRILRGSRRVRWMVKLLLDPRNPSSEVDDFLVSVPSVLFSTADITTASRSLREGAL